MSEGDNGSKQGRLAAGALAALGVVYGDIGTSPLYAFRECFSVESGVEVSPENVLGVLSLIFWALIVVVSIKYVAYIMRADHRGEGGVLALMTLVLSALPGKDSKRPVLVALGLFGACLLYGDGMITPAISVLGAVEGLEIATPALARFVVPIAMVILCLLFAVQHKGTEVVGRMFGPVTLLWFVCLIAMGLPWIARAPGVLAALSPLPAVEFLIHHHGQTAFVLGGVFLVVTGGEALYADMGHFGRKPIRMAWFCLVLPALVIHYFGQGALLIEHPEAIRNPFFLLAPDWALYPLVGLSTLATVIASQAVITGAFSLTRQAIHLGYLPRLEIRQTSAKHVGQIYLPLVNWVLLAATLGLVVGFGSSESLAGAYGVAVVTTMVVTTVLGFLCSRMIWKWSLLASAAASLTFLGIDLVFLQANAMKIPDGGWFPLAVAALVFFVMATWRKGHENLSRRLDAQRTDFQELLNEMDERGALRTPGTAVFLDRNPEGVPHILLRNLRSNGVVHQQVILLSVIPMELPKVPHDEQLEVADIGHGFFRVLAYYGFQEQPNIPKLLREARKQGIDYAGVQATTFFIGRETLVEGARHAMAWWREALFIFMSRNQRGADQYLRIPANRVIELGIQIKV